MQALEQHVDQAANAVRQAKHEKRDTATKAGLLTPLLEKYFVPGAASVEDISSSVSSQLSPNDLLSTILDCGGEIPRSMIDGIASDSSVAFQPAYTASLFQFLKSEIESAKLSRDPNQFALPDEIDSLKLLPAPAELTAVDEERDRKIAAFVQVNTSPSPNNRLSQRIAVIIAQKFLKRIESKTSSDELRDTVRKLLLPSEKARSTRNW